MRHTTKATNCPTCGERIQTVHHCRGRRPGRTIAQQIAEPPCPPPVHAMRAIYEAARAEARRAAVVEQPPLDGVIVDGTDGPVLPTDLWQRAIR